jgi:hypothetical protein
MFKASYLKFLWNSVNSHGVHSPFVYNLVANGFYAKQLDIDVDKNAASGLNKATLTTLFKTIRYFKSYKLLVLGEDTMPVTETIRTIAEDLNTKIWFYSPIVPVPGGVDLAYLAGENTASLLNALEELLPNINNNSVCVIANIHQTPEMESAWEAIKKDPNVTVTIDTYHLGLMFFRREQVRQHFIIRPYKSALLDAVLGIRNLWGLIG